MWKINLFANFSLVSGQKSVLKSLLVLESACNLRFKGSVNFLHANADQFTHPLHHMGKTPQDCPCIAIDSFKHMYLFPDYSKAYKKKYLLNFVKDLHSGKLHREFHHGPGKDKFNQQFFWNYKSYSYLAWLITGRVVIRSESGCL